MIEQRVLSAVGTICGGMLVFGVLGDCIFGESGVLPMAIVGILFGAWVSYKNRKV